MRKEAFTLWRLRYENESRWCKRTEKIGINCWIEHIKVQNILGINKLWIYYIQKHKYLDYRISFHHFIISRFMSYVAIYVFIYLNQGKLFLTMHVYHHRNELRKKIDSKKRLRCLKCECAYNIWHSTDSMVYNRNMCSS